MPEPDLVIFDCDGVLVDSEIIAARVEAELLSAAGYDISAAETQWYVRAASERTEKPLLARMPFGASIDHMHAAVDGGIDALVVCAPPRGTARDLAGRLAARLEFADPEEVLSNGADDILKSVIGECASIHQAIYETFVAYSLEQRLPA